METKYNLINCKNYFNDESLRELIDRIDAGEKVGIYIDCIGHTRTWIETQSYEEALQEYYGDDLIIDNETHWFTLYYKRG